MPKVGYVMPEEQKKKIGLGNKGKVVPIEVCNKISYGKTGRTYEILYGNNAEHKRLERSLLNKESAKKHKSDTCRCITCRGKRGELHKAQQNHCLDCGKEILRVSKRCASCSNKNKDKTRIISEKAKVRWSSDEFKETKDIIINKISKANYTGRVSFKKMLTGSKEYKDFRSRMFERDSYTCCSCYSVGGRLELHHKVSFAILLNEFLKLNPDLSPISDKITLLEIAKGYKKFFDADNMITLCRACHKKTHSYGRRPSIGVV